MDTTRILRPGDVVLYKDPKGVWHNALVTIWHGLPLEGGSIEDFRRLHCGGVGDSIPCVNLAYITPSTDKTDPYGHQLERASSVMHGSLQKPKNLGYCFAWPDEEK
jgi:hypothetical protein